MREYIRNTAMTDRVSDASGVYVVQRDTLKVFNAILQQDATNTTYKYALLRALVEISEEYAHHVQPVDDEWVEFPLGLIIEKWLYYYWPFIEQRLPQRHGELPALINSRKLAFRTVFERVTSFYRKCGGINAFARDLSQYGIPLAVEPHLIATVSKIRRTIRDYPMKHLGFSKYRENYQVARPKGGSAASRLRSPITREQLVMRQGVAQMRQEYFDTFRAVGGFATGFESIFAQWARFTRCASRDNPVSLTKAAAALMTTVDYERNVRAASDCFSALMDSGVRLECVWSGRKISGSGCLAIDHMIPFSLWGNNELWNLMPSANAVNSKKSDRIPDPRLITHRRHQISQYWRVLRDKHEKLFDTGFRLSLTGTNIDFDGDGWMDAGITELTSKCKYLIDERGFEPWTPI